MLRLVVVDDHEMLLRALETALSTAECIEIVATCTDGRQAVSAAAQLHPDVVLMDLSMPIMDGIEATRLIVAEHPGVRVLIHTAAAGEDQVREAFEAGAVGCVLKDIDVNKIVRAVCDATG
jgi:DNA-binding NarL/FixJ family response regulator